MVATDIVHDYRNTALICKASIGAVGNMAILVGLISIIIKLLINDNFLFHSATSLLALKCNILVYTNNDCH